MPRPIEHSGTARVDSFTLESGAEVALRIDWFHGNPNYKVQFRCEQHPGWKTMGSYGPNRWRAKAGFEALDADRDLARAVLNAHLN